MWRLRPTIQPRSRSALNDDRVTVLRFRILLRQTHQPTDPPHSIVLLRTHREQQRSRYTSEKRNKLAPPHLSPRYSHSSRPCASDAHVQTVAPLLSHSGCDCLTLPQSPNRLFLHTL